MRFITYVHPGGGEQINTVIPDPGDAICIKGAEPRDNGCRELSYWPTSAHNISAIYVNCLPTDAEQAAQDAMNKIIEEEDRKRRAATPPPSPAPANARKERGRK